MDLRYERWRFVVNTCEDFVEDSGGEAGSECGIGEQRKVDGYNEENETESSRGL